MSNRLERMDCYILAGCKAGSERDFERIGDETRLDLSFRNYAEVFDRVKLVLEPREATGRYLNYPHVCDPDSPKGEPGRVKAALKDARSEAIFIGSSEVVDFPAQLLVDLVRQYDGELFLGYRDVSGETVGSAVPFGIFNRRLAEQADYSLSDLNSVRNPAGEQIRFIPLPEGVDQALIATK